MISIRNYFLMVLLVATIICQFGVKAPRPPRNRNRGGQNAVLQLTAQERNNIRRAYAQLPLAHQLDVQSPTLDQQLDAINSYIIYLQDQVNTLSHQLGNADPTLVNVIAQGIFNYSY
uniref:Uncharacterized protein n=1 Tax=Meloidogyne floridensis TaxID=298350 RepID=A0A915NAK0_9BILA